MRLCALCMELKFATQAGALWRHSHSSRVESHSAVNKLLGVSPKDDNVRSAGGMLAVFAQPVQRSIAKQMTLRSMFICIRAAASPSKLTSKETLTIGLVPCPGRGQLVGSVKRAAGFPLMEVPFQEALDSFRAATARQQRLNMSSTRLARKC